MLRSLVGSEMCIRDRGPVIQGQPEQQVAHSTEVEQVEEECATQDVVGEPQWVQCFDEQHGLNYYVNSVSGDSQWERPLGDFKQLPWVQLYDEGSSRYFFLNSETEITQWEVPEGGYAAYEAGGGDDAGAQEGMENQEDADEPEGETGLDNADGTGESPSAVVEELAGQTPPHTQASSQGLFGEMAPSSAEASESDLRSSCGSDVPADTPCLRSSWGSDLPTDTCDKMESDKERRRQQQIEAMQERKRRAKEKLLARKKESNRPSVDEEAEHRSKVGLTTSGSCLSDPQAMPPPPQEKSPALSPRDSVESSPRTPPRSSPRSQPVTLIDQLTGKPVQPQACTFEDVSGPKPSGHIKMLDPTAFALNETTD
eukprot:TRINITY_DN4248_c0_g1_i3.p1 TRINITY_DN4248_c0_g1~~TRINITY_DN4248_c0_g1_i3.p1  ORF type:complete len:370 (-),score=77.02 TRINITY_DN4248_c0_g1_i3:289-1398(-)